MGIPFIINFLGLITGCADKKGNNFYNLYKFFLERTPVYGLFQYYNLFNFDGWFSMLLTLIYILPFGLIIEPWYILIVVLTGDLLVADFDATKNGTTTNSTNSTNSTI